MVSLAVALRSPCGRRAGANRALSNRRAVARCVPCATTSNADILPAKALRTLCGGTRRKPRGLPEPVSPCGTGRRALPLPPPRGCAPASRAGHTRPGIRQSTCRGRCRKTSAPRPASPRQAPHPPSPYRKGSRPGDSRRPTPTGFARSGCLPAPNAGLSSWPLGAARSRRIT